MFETMDDGASQIETCINEDEKCEIDMMKDLATKIDNDHDRIFSTYVPETWAVA